MGKWYFGGIEPTKVFIGSSEVSKVYYGSTLIWEKAPAGYTYTVDMSTTNCTPNFNFPQSTLLSNDTELITTVWTQLFGNDGLVFVPSFEDGKATIFAYAYIETTEEELLLEYDYTHANNVNTINGQIGATITSADFSSSDTISYTDTPLSGSFDYDKYNLTNHEYSLNATTNATVTTNITASTFTSDIGISSHLYDDTLANNNVSVNLAITYNGTKQTGDYILHPNNTSLTTLWQTGSGASLIRIQGRFVTNALTGKQINFSVRLGRSATATLSVAIRSIIIY